MEWECGGLGISHVVWRKHLRTPLGSGKHLSVGWEFILDRRGWWVVGEAKAGRTSASQTSRDKWGCSWAAVCALFARPGRGRWARELESALTLGPASAPHWLWHLGRVSSSV